MEVLAVVATVAAMVAWHCAVGCWGYVSAGMLLGHVTLLRLVVWLLGLRGCARIGHISGTSQHALYAD